ncbi:hypothetical protein EDI_277450 [Entamoeba dispar SAW760]|uniref:Leucine rich repeat containing protein BspA family protein n=1 Tax=Entamoeba dispar (strain ATCC PRA-260 / SAW760) TaxID=370354 RepID=B0ESG5_ENTDS|nr:uncharacterized protein EDI_277450 [Entamoeba dispar SAW760]EDR22531.1 hypothetical protein EDI_277450 [Entamoeba dispar SAW760]|eukprot:EDR22531.1 hypothetical protein EDI_277450 [Entamoeba dispar SAW760]
MNKDIGYVGKCSFWNCKSLINNRSSGKIHNYQSIPYWVWMILKEENNSVEEIEYTNEDREKDIGNECFGYCTNLTKIEIHEGIKENPKGFMKYCGQIQRIELPQSITKINTESFKESIKLKEINIKPNTIIIEKGAFEKCPNNNYE